MIRAKSAFLALLAILLSPTVANAIPVTWEITGEFDQITGSPGVLDGDPFRVLVNFDTDAALDTVQTGGRFDPGARYQYNASDLSFLVSLPGQADQLIRPFGDGQDLLWLRDNSGDRSCCEFAEVDGLTFALVDANGFGASIILRGSILDIFDGGALPTDPDPRLLNLEIAAFQWLVGESFATGRISSINRISVPEPGTLALLVIGLAAIATRRKPTA